MKERAERAKALKADFKTNVCDAQAAPGQQLFGALDTLFHQVLVRRPFEDSLEESYEVVARKAGFA